MPYTTKTQVENYLLTTIQAVFDSQITTWINAVDAWIDTYPGREFESSADTSSDIFSPNTNIFSNKCR